MSAAMMALVAHGTINMFYSSLGQRSNVVVKPKILCLRIVIIAVWVWFEL